MKNTIIDPKLMEKSKRINYYNKKVADFMKMRPSDPWYLSRLARLQQYKRLLNRYLAE